MKSYFNLRKSAFPILCSVLMTCQASGQSAYDVVINEIMYAPVTGASGEWFEIYNKSASSFNLNNWKWKDATTNIHTITTQNITLAPNTFAVVCQDSVALKTFYPNVSGIILQSMGWNSLNNTGDQVILYSPSGLTIDSVSYLPSWGGSSNNISLERILASGPSNQQSNWGSSIDPDGATPNLINSLTVGGSTGGTAIINEIMYDFPPGECEWVELFNNSDSVVNLKGWKIQDNTTNQVIITSQDYFLSPDSFVVVSESDTIFTNHPTLPQNSVIINSSLPSLNNEGDAVIILKPNGVFSDRVDYLPLWGGDKVSLEKINPSLPSNNSSSWGSCVYPVGSSPGQQNSIYTKVLPSLGEISVSPNPFSPDGDGFEDYAIISYKLTSYFSQSRVKIYDVKGRLVRTLLNNQAVGSSGSIVFDGMDDSKQKLHLGIYIIFFEALDDHNGVVEQLKTTVVVAAKL